MKRSVLFSALLLAFIGTRLCTETSLEIAQTTASAEPAPGSHPQIDKDLDKFIEELDIDGFLNEAGLPHSAATKDLQGLIDEIEGITAEHYSDDFKEEHFDFVELNIDL